MQKMALFRVYYIHIFLVQSQLAWLLPQYASCLWQELPGGLPQIERPVPVAHGTGLSIDIISGKGFSKPLVTVLLFSIFFKRASDGRGGPFDCLGNLPGNADHRKIHARSLHFMRRLYNASAKLKNMLVAQFYSGYSRSKYYLLSLSIIRIILITLDIITRFNVRHET